MNLQFFSKDHFSKLDWNFDLTLESFESLDFKTKELYRAGLTSLTIFI